MSGYVKGQLDSKVERLATVLLNRRGFGFYSDPMEGGQDAYDLSQEAIEEVRALLAAGLLEPIDPFPAGYREHEADRARRLIARNTSEHRKMPEHARRNLFD